MGEQGSQAAFDKALSQFLFRLATSARGFRPPLQYCIYQENNHDGYRGVEEPSIAKFYYIRPHGYVEANKDSEPEVIDILKESISIFLKKNFPELYEPNLAKKRAITVMCMQRFGNSIFKTLPKDIATTIAKQVKDESPEYRRP